MLYHKAKTIFRKHIAFRSFISVIFSGVKKNRIAALLALVLQLNIAIPALAASTLSGEKFAYLFNTICTSMGTKIVTTEGDISKPHIQNFHCASCAAGNSPPPTIRSHSFTGNLFNALVITTTQKPTLPTKLFWPPSSARAPPAII
jgi:hypothetical protein